MRVDYWLDAIAALIAINATRLQAGEITVAEADKEEMELLMRARVDLSREDIAELLRRILTRHQFIADDEARNGRPCPGNDSANPN